MKTVRATPGRFEAVVFDFFGTLTLPVTHATQVAAVGPVAAAMGVSPERLMTILAATFNDRCRGRWGSFQSTMERLAREAGAQLSPEALAAVCQTRIAGQREHLMRVRREAEGVLRELRGCGLGIGVVSDCTHELAMAWDQLPLARLVDVRALSVEERVKKPDPHLYLLAAERLAVDPGRCLYVGDGGSNELNGATAVGMTAVLLDDPVGRTAIVYDRDEWKGAAIARLDAVVDLVRCPSPSTRPRTPHS